MFSYNDKVKIVTEGDGVVHVFSIGDQCRIVKVYADDFYEVDRGDTTQTVMVSDIEKL